MIDPLYVKLYQKDIKPIELRELLQFFYELQTKEEYVKIDRIISTVNVRRIEDDIIIALVRCLKDSSSKLTKWDLFHEKIRKHLLFKDKAEVLTTVSKAK